MTELMLSGNGEDELQLDDSQQIAVDRCCDCSAGNRIVPVTGPAGTGKTTIIRIVYETLIKAGFSVVLCAPTGKAAKRITEATGIQAMTIHRLLEYPHPGERDEITGKPMCHTDPKRTAKNPIVFDCVIADEYAMVNYEVHSNLVFALPRGGRLLMFGDVNQLRPIERTRSPKAESPFQAGIRRFDGVKLKTVHRYGAGSGIARNGKLILNGNVPRRADDFQLKFSQSPVDTLREYVLEYAEKGADFGGVNNQIISPIKKSWVGTYKLNLMLQDVFNPRKPVERTSMPRHKWESKLPLSLAIGDKVIWTENSYDLRSYPDNVVIDDDSREHYTETPPNLTIMNGETGIIMVIHPDGAMDIDTGDRTVNIPSWVIYNAGKKGLVGYDPRKAIDLAYVITTHKAQGSEYKNVVYIINKSSGMMQCRSNIYTAITRARQNACIVTDQQSLTASVTREFNIMEMRK